MLYNFAPDRRARDLMMNSIAPIWDGNETWLVLGSLGLLAAFPLAFAIIIPAVYFPILLMLLALIFRGLAFEFRFRDAEHRTFWDHGFAYGSALATFAQGVVLGAFIQGFQVEGRHFVGGSFDCFTPFSVFTGLALDVRLCAARRRLAGDQDRGRPAGLGARARPALPHRHRAGGRGRQPVDAVHRSRISRRAGSPGPTSRSWRRCRSSPPAWSATVWWSLDHGSDYGPFLGALGLFVHVLSGHRHQPVADDRAATFYA